MALKGKTTIQIFDGTECIQETHDENMLTNAAATILNPPDFIELGLDRETDRSKNMLFVFENDLTDTAFRGVIVCRDAIPEDADNMMLPWTNEEIGHAGIATTDTEATIGTYNATESGRIENGSGYRHVWDFGTDKANGEIACVCMTTKDGGTNGYHNTFWSLNSGGIDLNSSSTSAFTANTHTFLSRYISDSTLNASEYKFFYMDRQESGNVRLLGKGLSDGAIYEVIINNPFSIGIREDKPHCEILSVTKVIEVFPAPTMVEGGTSSTVYFHSSYYYDASSSSSSNIPDDEKANLLASWEDEAPWMCYFPYVKGKEIHIVGTTINHFYHIIYDVDTYAELSHTKTAAAVPLQNYHTDYFYVDKGSGNSPRYRWSYGCAVNALHNSILSGVYWDDKYFLITENPLIDGAIDTSINNYGQFRIFEADGTATDSTFQYASNSNISSSGSSYYWYGFYIDEKTNTPLFVTYPNVDASQCSIVAVMPRKTSGGYDYYRFRLGTSASTVVSYYVGLTKVQGMSLPLYACQAYPSSSSSSHLFSYTLGILKECLTTINNLSEPVRKLDGQTMKITYDIVEE